MWKQFKLVAEQLGSFEVSKKTLVRELIEQVQQNAHKWPPNQQQQAVDFLKEYATTKKADLKEAEGRMYLRQTCKAVLAAKMLQSIHNNPDPDNLEGMLNKFEQTRQVVSNVPMDFAAAGLVNPLANYQRYWGHAKKVRFGIDYLDTITYGGVGRGTTTAFIGPTGGGKTFTTIQMALSQCKQGNVVLWCTYEQGLEGDIIERTVAAVTDTKLTSVRRMAQATMTDDIRDRLQHVQSRYQDKLFVRDFSQQLCDEDGNILPMDQQRAGSAKDIIELVDLMIANGKKPDMIIIDWLGEMITLVAASRNKDISDPSKWSSLAAKELAELKSYCKTKEIAAVIFHQLTAACNDRAPKTRPTGADSMNWKGFATNMDYTFIMGTRCKATDVCWLVNSKNRSGPPTDHMIKLEAEDCRFVLADGKFETDPAGNGFRKLGEKAEVPNTHERDRQEKEQRKLRMQEEYSGNGY